MGIGSISDYSALFQNYRVPNISASDMEQILGEKEEHPVTQDFTTDQPEVVSGETKQASNQTNLEDVSLSFKIEEDYSLKGSQSDITSLDIRKAISDMRRDQVLQQYQYFAGSSGLPQNAESNPDGKVIIKDKSNKA